jgi:hypothetical protein
MKKNRGLLLLVCIAIFASGCAVSQSENHIFQNTENITNEFLERHLFGQWRFAERIISVDSSGESMLYDTVFNISDEGVEEFREHTVLYYSEQSAEFVVRVGQRTFTNPRDMFLFGAYGGFNWIQNPHYQIEEMNSDTVTLRNIYAAGGANTYTERIPGFENYIRVYCAAQSDEGLYTPRLMGRFLADTIYINPNDENTIYVEFCGIWRMERDNRNFGTGTTSEY